MNRMGMAHEYLDDAVEYEHADWFHSRIIDHSTGTLISFLELDGYRLGVSVRANTSNRHSGSGKMSAFGLLILPNHHPIPINCDNLLLAMSNSIASRKLSMSAGAIEAAKLPGKLPSLFVSDSVISDVGVGGVVFDVDG